MRDSRNRRINARTRLAENTYEYKYERVRDRHETSRILIIDVQIILDILISWYFSRKIVLNVLLHYK